MDSNKKYGEDIAPDVSNNIIQDLTYVMILKDFHKDMTIDKPKNYDRSEFICSYSSGECPQTDKKLWSKDKLISYGKLPNNKYMINWPINGNDYYSNSIEMTAKERLLSYEEAKQKSLRFLYFIQTEMNYTNLSIDYDEYQTKDGFPVIPYHRESRRSEGMVTLTLNDIKSPYSNKNSIYRTGIAVGDYPVDHHHGAYDNYVNLPRLDFYPVPSYSVPIGSLVPKGIDNFIIAEKSISVSNLVNGTTRLQPVVMQIGQAAGILAHLSTKNNKSTREVNIREIQSEILKSKGYILPYADVESDHPNFLSYQKIGACGILRSKGVNIGWENKTFFYPNKDLEHNQIFSEDWNMLGSPPQELSIINVLEWLYDLNGENLKTEKELKDYWETLNLKNFSKNRIIKRGEFAVLLDDIINPFLNINVDFLGNLIPNDND